MKRSTLAAGFATLALAACSAPVVIPPPPAPTPTPSPTPAPMPTPTPSPTPTPAYAHWMDAPQTPGDWFYKQIPPYTYAAFGRTDTDFEFVMRCDRASRTVSLGRVSAQTTEQPVQVMTESLTRLLTGFPRQGGIEHLIAVDLPANDELLDAMAISKGRFAVQVRGEPTLYIPSWPEVTRVIEDCR